MRISIKILFTIQLAFLPFYSYPQYSGKIKPVQRYAGTNWGYEDLHGEWIISPQFSGADNFNKDGIAEVIIDKNYRPTSWGIRKGTKMGFIDFNGDILAKYTYGIPQEQKDKKYKKAINEIKKRNEEGAYNLFYDKVSQVDEQIMSTNRQHLLETQRRDSIQVANRRVAKRADSIALAKKMQEDSIKRAESFRRRTFSYFAESYIAKEYEEWSKRGKFEKTEDYQKRVNDVIWAKKDVKKEAEAEYKKKPAIKSLKLPNTSWENTMQIKKNLLYRAITWVKFNLKFQSNMHQQ